MTNLDTFDTVKISLTVGVDGEVLRGETKQSER